MLLNFNSETEVSLIPEIDEPGPRFDLEVIQEGCLLNTEFLVPWDWLERARENASSLFDGLGQQQELFEERLARVLSVCQVDHGVEMRIYSRVREPSHQAKLWRQSRTTQEIEAQMQTLRTAGAAFLARCIEQVGPQYGRWATNAIPGLSWHQYGLAADVFWVLHGESEWSITKRPTHGENGYEVLRDVATENDLTSGWRFNDWTHLQLPEEPSPATHHSLKQIDALMRDMFEHEAERTKAKFQAKPTEALA